LNFFLPQSKAFANVKSLHVGGIDFLKGDALIFGREVLRGNQDTKQRAFMSSHFLKIYTNFQQV